MRAVVQSGPRRAGSVGAALVIFRAQQERSGAVAVSPSVLRVRAGADAWVVVVCEDAAG